MVMNDLALRLTDTGYKLKDNTALGTLLYADGILLLDRSASISAARCRLVDSWLAEWGGKVNPDQTRGLTVNGCTTLGNSPTDAALTPTAFWEIDSCEDNGKGLAVEVALGRCCDLPGKYRR